MIKVSTRCRYGLIAMVELNRGAGNLPVSVREIFKKHHIPKFYLEQLLMKLKRHNLISSIRGPGGGFVLKKNPHKIKIIDIIKAVEGPIDLVKCASDSDKHSCQKMRKCLTRSMWLELNKAINDILNKKTLADLTR